MGILFSFLLAAGFAQATEKWWIGNVALDVVEAPEGGLVNPSCLKNPKCQAHLAVKAKSRSAKPGVGGKSPGSDACVREHKGRVVIAASGETTQAFCQFPDDSFASLDGLTP